VRPYFSVRLLYRLVGTIVTGGRRGPPSIDQRAFVDAMAKSVQGVAIVTTDGRAGRFGLTVSSVASVSAEPPFVLTSINRRSPAAGAVLHNGVFAVNLLAVQQHQLADVFAGRSGAEAPYSFGAAVWQKGSTGSPLLEEAVARLDCTLHRSITAGTHHVMIGRCVGAETADGPALLYTHRRYGLAITPFKDATAGAPSPRAGLTQTATPSSIEERQQHHPHMEGAV
jgi:flavin reductase (DIM6/NTAB) family NADH-FMN oxidoreductase RutF